MPSPSSGRFHGIAGAFYPWTKPSVYINPYLPSFKQEKQAFEKYEMGNRDINNRKPMRINPGPKINATVGTLLRQKENFNRELTPFAQSKRGNVILKYGLQRSLHVSKSCFILPHRQETECLPRLPSHSQDAAQRTYQISAERS